MELNRYVYAANRPINLSDPSGRAAATEYGLLIPIGIGAAVGIAQTYTCGGDLGQNIAIGALFGAGFGMALAIEVLAPYALALGSGLSLYGAGSAFYDGIKNGFNKCNSFTAALNLVFLGWGIRGIQSHINNNLLGGLGDYGVPDEFLPSNGWNEGYYTGEYQPIRTDPQGLIDWVVKNWFSQEYFRRTITIGEQKFQFITSSEPRYRPIYDPNLTEAGAADLNGIRIGQKAINLGPYQVLKTIFHEEGHLWMDENNYLQVNETAADAVAEQIANLLLRGWSGWRGK